MIKRISLRRDLHSPSKHEVDTGEEGEAHQLQSDTSQEDLAADVSQLVVLCSGESTACGLNEECADIRTDKDAHDLVGVDRFEMGMSVKVSRDAPKEDVVSYPSSYISSPQYAMSSHKAHLLRRRRAAYSVSICDKNSVVCN